jgi:hypothetical protein
MSYYIRQELGVVELFSDLNKMAENTHPKSDERIELTNELILN